jgi:hypothetical protein
LLGACVIGVALAIAIWKAFPHNPPAATPPPPDQVADRGTQPEPKPEPKAEPPAQPPMPEPKAAETNPMPEAKPPAPEPKPAETKPTEPKPPETPPAPQVAKPDRSPSAERKDVGVFASKDAVLLAQSGDAWAKVAPDANLGTATSFLALPGWLDDPRLPGDVARTARGV